MNWIVTKIKLIMLISGTLTCTMLYAAIAPQAALQSTFGETLKGPLAEIVVRNWGALIALVGIMLIYGAINPISRILVLTVAGVSKLTFICLLLLHGQHYLGRQAGITIVVDLIMVSLFMIYLIAVRRSQSVS